MSLPTRARQCCNPASFVFRVVSFNIFVILIFYSHAEFMTFISPHLDEEFGMKKNPFTKFLGHRFNVLGRNAVYAYGLREKIAEFVKFRDNNNQLLRSIGHDVNVPEILAGIRVFGLASRLLWEALWALLEDKSVNIASMGAVFEKLIVYLERNADDPTGFLEGQSPFDEEYVRRDQWLQCLLDANSQLDDLTTTIAVITMKSFVIFAKRQFSDYLPGGIHADLSEEEGRSIPKTNKKCESYFAYWDREVSNY